jgi:trimeric autotransporter adhesin
VGAPKEDGWNNTLPYAGAAYVFGRSNGVWDEEEYNSPGKAYMWFGHSVAISSDEILVGAYGDNSSATGVEGNPDLTDMPTSGAAYLITHTHDAWTGSRFIYLKASNTGAADRFGMAVAMSDKWQVVSAEFEDSSATGVNGDQADNSAADSGAVYVFRTLPKQAMLPMILR